MSTYQKEYYASKKSSILASRKERYKTDSAYRDTIKKARQRSTDKVKMALSKKPAKYTTDLTEVLETLDITVWRFREWLKNEYFPKPAMFGKKFWFTTSQLALLVKLRSFFLNTGRRLTRAERAAIEILSDEIAVNWINDEE